MTDPIEFQSQSARFGLPFLFAGQAQKEFFVNDAFARLDFLLHPVIEEELPDPPADPDNGKAWLAGDSATGDWAGRDGMIAGYQANSWVMLDPTPGMRVWDRATSQLLVFTDTWQRLAEPSLPTGGTTVDTEARSAIINLIETLRNAGVFPEA